MPPFVIVIRFTVCVKVLSPEQKEGEGREGREGEEGVTVSSSVSETTARWKHTVYKTPATPAQWRHMFIDVWLPLSTQYGWEKQAPTHRKLSEQNRWTNKQTNYAQLSLSHRDVFIRIYKLEIYEQWKHVQGIIISTIGFHRLIVILVLI